jgi:hypothetical protein
VARLARDAGFAPRLRVDGKPSAEDLARGYESSSWAVIARRSDDLAAVRGDRRWREPRLKAASPLWTDDYSSLVSVLR